MKLAIVALAVAPRAKASNYPEPFASRMRGRVKRPLGDHFGLRNFGVNLTELASGGESALLHRHSRQSSDMGGLTPRYAIGGPAATPVDRCRS